jgi:23S rRNA pseudouridine1911/1915/1917 synthase
MNVSIIFEDASFLAINKPVGIVVNRAESVKGETIQDWMESVHPIFSHVDGESQEQSDFVSRSGVVHRIDKETSGILLIAKTFLAFIELQRQFKERIIKKTYLAIVHGELVPKEGEVRAPVGRLPWNRERFGIVPGGKDSVTKYTCLATKEIEGTHDKISLVAVFPETGRTHQIRVHMKYINHPLLGDYLYAGRKTSRDDREWAPRVMLHAWKIVLLHPETKNELAIEAPIPDDMNSIIPYTT